jgi:hypothetical protein
LSLNIGSVATAWRLNTGREVALGAAWPGWATSKNLRDEGFISRWLQLNIDRLRQ